MDEDDAIQMRRGDRKVLIKFTLKPGAHLLLFHPKYMALMRSGKVNAVIAEVVKQRAAQEGRQQEGIFPAAHGGEGNLGGFIGLKAEQLGDFSLSVRGNALALLFQLLLESVSLEREDIV
jgi:hypothetical protein